uniref:ATP synthase complex subunit 8 n=1 Tax=Psilotreta sp. XG-2021 TaxID=2996739 RepID=A0A9E8LP94_9NEOP|nr:ATP synthase F0 subunit 8 [Psilotreta sp. XG-2021]
MPQMMPLNWLILYFFFFICFMIVIFLNYSIYIIMNNTKMKKKIKTNIFFWK